MLHEMIAKGNLAKNASYTGKEIKDAVMEAINSPASTNDGDCYDSTVLAAFRKKFIDNKFPLGNTNRYFITWKHTGENDSRELIAIRDRNDLIEKESEGDKFTEEVR